MINWKAFLKNSWLQTVKKEPYWQKFWQLTTYFVFFLPPPPLRKLQNFCYIEPVAHSFSVEKVFLKIL